MMVVMVGVGLGHLALFAWGEGFFFFKKIFLYQNSILEENWLELVEPI